MPLLIGRDDNESDDHKPRISKRTAIIIGTTIGAIYLYITVILIFIFLRRRHRKRKLQEARRSYFENHQTIHLGFDDSLPSSRSQDANQLLTRAPTRRYRQRSSCRMSFHPGVGSTTSLGPRGPTRSFHHPQHSYTTTTLSRPEFRRTYSEGTVIRGQPGANNPFWMFDASNSRPSLTTRNSSFHTFRRYSSDSLSQLPSSTFPLSQVASRRSSSALSMPTSVFISEMNARYPSASILPPLSISSKSLAYIRHVPRSRSNSLASPLTPNSSGLVVQEMREKQDGGFLPPVPITPLVTKKSIDRIVSGEYFSHRKTRSKARVKARDVLKMREKDKLKGKKSGEIVRLVTVKRVTAKDRKVVRVDSGGAKGHGRIKSLSALSDLILGFWTGKKAVVEEVAGENAGEKSKELKNE